LHSQTIEGPIIASLASFTRQKLRTFKILAGNALTLNRLTDLVSNRYTLLIIFLAYLWGMFIGPLIVSFDWEYLQKVWERWQSLNVGVLALISSVLVFKATKYHSEQTRERQYIAARALLPEAMSELDDYCLGASKALKTLWYEEQSLHDVSEFSVSYPELPQKYKSTFRDCISYSEKNFGTHLARIIANLQLFDSYLSSSCKPKNSKKRDDVSQHRVIVMMVLLSKIHALVNLSYAHARGLEEFQLRELTIDDYEKSFTLIGLIHYLDYEETDEVRSMAHKAIAKPSGVFSL
jgi:hypothetical protein